MLTLTLPCIDACDVSAAVGSPKDEQKLDFFVLRFALKFTSQEENCTRTYNIVSVPCPA